MSAKKSKTIHYKRAVLTKSSVLLQELVTRALSEGSKAHKASARREFLNENDQSCRLINNHSTYNGMLFGQLIYLEPGASQALVTLKDDAESYTIKAITPESIGSTDEISSHGLTESVVNNKDKNEIEKIRREFIDSFLYFGVLDNDLVILQSSSLRARELEAHLAWLLGTCVTSIDKNTAVILQDRPTKEAEEKLRKSPVKTVKLGAPINVGHDTTEKIESNVKTVKWIPVGTGANILSSLVGENWFNTLNLKDSLDEANLQISLQITYLRKTTKSGRSVLDSLATSLRHTEGSDVAIDLDGGGKISGDELKLSGRISVNFINGLIDESDLYHQMHDWLVTKVSTDEIETSVLPD